MGRWDEARFIACPAEGRWMERIGLPVILFLVVSLPAGAQAQTARSGVEAFNHRLEEATLRMDNAAVMALREEDGISLLPATKPMIGKAAIAEFLDKVTASIPGAKMEKFEMKCFAIEVSGDLATEWCNEHQVVRLPGNKPPFDGRGRMLLVLRRGRDGKWRMEREMWNQAEAGD
jgi:ketosteroid isomerase-like protein